MQELNNLDYKFIIWFFGLVFSFFLLGYLGSKLKKNKRKNENLKGGYFLNEMPDYPQTEYTHSIKNFVSVNKAAPLESTNIESRFRLVRINDK